MNRSEVRALREMAREMRLPASVVETALECGALREDDPLDTHRRVLRQMRRIMNDLGVNAPGAALLVRMRRDLELLQAEVQAMRRLEARLFGDWRDGIWREFDF